VEITVLGFADCPHLGLVRHRLGEALECTVPGVRVHERLVDEHDDLERLGFRGSPTILVDGRDPFPGARGTGLFCRVYRTPDGGQGAPTVDQLVEVLRR
jgi:hypothetical protein